MKLKIILIIQTIIISLTSCSNSQENKIKGEEIWKNYINSIGSREKILNIKTYSDSTVTTSKHGIIISKTKVKYPDKIFQEITYPNGEVLTLIINGNSGIRKFLNRTETLSDKYVAKYKIMGLIILEFYYLDLGYKVELVGEEIFNNKSYYNLRVSKNAKISNYIIDKQNYNVFRLITNSDTTEIKKITKKDGIKVATESTYTRGGETNSAYNIEFNANISDEIFEIVK